MLTIVIALALLAQTSSTVGQQPAFVVGEKVAGSVGFYDAQFKRLGGVKVGVHPHEMWLSADKRTLYVADNGVLWMTETGPGENTVSVIDVPSQRRTAVIDLGQFRRPHGITFDEASGRVWVTTEQPSQLLSVDPVKRQVLRRYDVQGKAPHIVNIGLGGWAFSSNTDTGTVAAINTDSGEVRLISSGARPQGQALSPDRKTLYVANSGESSISILDLERKTRIATIPTGRAPVRLALLPDGKTLIYALQEGRSVDSPISKAVRRFSKSRWPGDQYRSRYPRTGGWPIARFRKRTRSTSSPFRNGRSRASTTHRKALDPTP